MPNSDPNPYGLSWYAATASASPARPRLTAETDVDVCVIGGGLAGLTVAREIVRRGWSVVVLEQNSIAWNASGRNTGFVLPGFAADAEAVVTRVGLDHARQLWALSEAGAEYVRDTARELGSETGLTENGWLHVSKTDRNRTMAQRYELLTGQFGAEIEAWPVERVREELRSPSYFSAMHYPRGFSIHPLNYALGLAAAAEAAGVRIHEDSAALQIDPVGVRKRIAVKDARVRAAHVVLAGNVHLHELMPDLAATLLPVFSYVVVTERLGRALRELIRTEAAVSDTELADSHYRIVDGDRLMWAGRSTVWHDKPARCAKALLGEAAKTYPSLRGVKAEYAWTGTVGLTVHRMPQIGEVSPGLWLLSGFGGHGLNTTAMGGELLARAIVDGDTTWRLFQPFGMVWAGGMLGRATQQAHYWSFRAREEVEGALARRRDVKRRGAAPPHDIAAGVLDTPRFDEPEEQLAPMIAPDYQQALPAPGPMREPKRRDDTAPDGGPPTEENR